MAVPDKYRVIGNFWEYYSGEYSELFLLKLR